MGNPRHGEPAIVADTRNSFAATEDDGDLASAVTDLDFNGGNAGSWLDAHATNLATHVDPPTHRHVGQCDHVQFAKLCAKAFGNEFVLGL